MTKNEIKSQTSGKSNKEWRKGEKKKGDKLVKESNKNDKLL